MRIIFIAVQILCLVGGYAPGYAQNNTRLSTHVKQQSPYYSQQTARLEQADLYTVRPDFSFTSVSLRIDSGMVFDGSYLVHRQDTFYLDADEHLSEDISFQVSNLVIFDTPVEEVRFYPGAIRGDVIWSFFNAEGGKKDVNEQLRTQQPKQRSEACEEPDFVPATTWRAGLPPPSYNRLITSVEHVIVHHSATYNTLNDYDNVVRNIYLFHTQDRGWSDIGYNYLIAQDGTIFEGRSAGANDQAHDNVQGAHFCGQNSRTMGICLLGNYNTAEPSDPALTSLVKLTAWKVNKEGLEPLSARAHPANATLGTVAGHRDGCDTECPGENLYARLGEIRIAVADYIDRGCQQDNEAVVSVYPVPADGTLNVSLSDTLSLETIRAYDMTGKIREVTLPNSSGTFQVDTHAWSAGAYVLCLRGPGWEERRTILIQ